MWEDVSVPSQFKGIRFYSGRAIPRGTTLKTTVMGLLVIVEGSVPGGPKVCTPCAVVEDVIVLDDYLFFSNELVKALPT